MRRARFAKIVATLGPASSSREQLRALFEAGADVFRLNFSHGTQDDHKQRVALLRALEKQYKHPIAILMDLQGPKLRLGVVGKGPIELKKGQKLRFDMEKAPGTAKRVPLPHPEIFKAAQPGGILLIDDGKVRLRIEAHTEATIDTVVEVAGPITDRKGVNLPQTDLPISPLTSKDREDLAFGLELGVDWVALSFVQRPSDVIEAQGIVQGRAGIMAKIEKPAALGRIDDIVALHTAPDYVVYALGSHPGYCYLGGMDPRLATPRRKSPVLSIPGGAVSIGGAQTGISASTGPSGWPSSHRTRSVSGSAQP